MKRNFIVLTYAAWWRHSEESDEFFQEMNAENQIQDLKNINL